MVETTKNDLNKAFDMTDLGLLHYCLGLEVWQANHLIFVSQRKHAKILLEKFKMVDSKPMSAPIESGLQLSTFDTSSEVNATLYRQMIGGLIYLTYTRPDISFAVNYLSRFMQEPKMSHQNAAKRVLRYINGTVDHGLEYK